mgnify:CR=1 FL=1
MRDFYDPTDWRDDDAESLDLAAERRARRHYERELMRHPDPRDPDHPGIFGEDE